MNTLADLTVTGSGTGSINLTGALTRFNGAEICLTDAPLFVMEADEDGGVTNNIYSATWTKNATTDTILEATSLTFKGSAPTTGSYTVMVDYYIDLPSADVYEADITEDTFAGYYYVEADTLFRRQSDGVDLPANLTFPNVKLQSNFTITMSGSGDPGKVNCWAA